MKDKKIILIVGVVALVTGCYFSKIIIDNKNIKEKAKEQEQALKCYEWLYNEDDILTGCGKYFKSDIWYQDYLNSQKKTQEV